MAILVFPYAESLIRSYFSVVAKHVQDRIPKVSLRLRGSDCLYKIRQFCKASFFACIGSDNNGQFALALLRPIPAGNHAVAREQGEGGLAVSARGPFVPTRPV
jgi:hypothetical protein